MANKERGEVALQVGKEALTLRLSINAIAEIETYLDMGFREITGMLQDTANFRVGNWRVMLWGALREHHPCSIEEAGDIMAKAGMNEAIAAVGEAMTLAFPNPKEADEENPPKANRQVGKTSSRTGSSTIQKRSSGR